MDILTNDNENLHITVTTTSQNKSLINTQVDQSCQSLLDFVEVSSKRPLKPSALNQLESTPIQPTYHLLEHAKNVVVVEIDTCRKDIIFI